MATEKQVEAALRAAHNIGVGIRIGETEMRAALEAAERARNEEIAQNMLEAYERGRCGNPLPEPPE